MTAIPFRGPRTPRTEQRGGPGHCALQHLTEKKDVLFTQKRGARKKKSTTEIKGFSGTAHHQILSAAMKDVRDLSMGRGGGKLVVSRSVPAQTLDTSPCLTSTARGKLLQILGKWRETNHPTPCSIHEPVGLVVIKENKCLLVCNDW